MAGQHQQLQQQQRHKIVHFSIIAVINVYLCIRTVTIIVSYSISELRSFTRVANLAECDSTITGEIRTKRKTAKRKEDRHLNKDI